jgi:cyanophycinase
LLLGSGEFEPWAEAVERQALEGAGGDGTVVVLATASAPEGEAVFSGWGRAGVRHFEGLGLPTRALPVRDREDAERRDMADAVASCSLVFCSGGDPGHLSRTLSGSRLLSGIRRLLEAGGVYAGCSAGAMVVGAPGPSGGRFSFGTGLGLLRREVIGVHWDAAFAAPWRAILRSRVPPGCRLIGVAERTAVLGGESGWTVHGRGRVEVRDGAGSSWFSEGEEIPGRPG